MADKVIKFFSDSSDVKVVRAADRDTSLVVEVSGDVFKEVEHLYQTVQFGRSSQFPRSQGVFASSSVEVYSSPRLSNVRQKKSLTTLSLSTGSESTSHASIGVSNQSFVSMPVSASMHEVYVMGNRLSGTQAVAGPVPYTSSLFYEKDHILRKTVWKLTASADMGGFVSARGVLIASTASVTSPHIFSISAPNNGSSDESGRIVDVKVWVEILQVSSSNAHPPLGQFGLSLRSPNVSWGHAHPIRNYNRDSTFDAPYEAPSEFYRNTFLLWEPASLFRSLKTPYSGNATGDFDRLDPAFRSPCWDRDIGMRTVFCDGAGVRNPRDIMQVYLGQYRGVNQSERAFDSPNAGWVVATTPTASMLGNGVPWMNNLHTSASDIDGIGSPPDGWLTAKGGVNSDNEWPTTGSNIGPVSIRPVYPLLDDIIVRKIFHTDGFDVLDPRPNVRQYWRSWESKRPGLRGTEMSGRWELLIAHGSTGSLTGTPTYFRQLRIEFTYDVTPGTSRKAITPPRTPRRASAVPKGSGLNLISVISGSKDFNFVKSNLTDAAPDFFINGVFVQAGYEIDSNRAVGLTYDIDRFYANGLAVYTASVDVFTATASYDRSSVTAILSPSVVSTGPRTLTQVIVGTDSQLTTAKLAARELSGTL